MTRTSRRRFGKTLAAATVAATSAAAQKKQMATQAADESSSPPCSVNPGLAEYDIPRSTEPAFTFST